MRGRRLNPTAGEAVASNLLKNELDPEVGAAVDIGGSLLGPAGLKVLLE
jgi:hypothetical protein